MNRKSRKSSVQLFVFLVFTLLLTVSCGTLEVGIEGTDSPDGQDAPGTVDPTAEVTPEITLVPTEMPLPEPTSTPPAEPTLLSVVFVQDGDAWLWREGEEAVSLTGSGGVEGVKISDDGAVVAFVRAGELWAVNSDGTDERRLVGSDNLAGMMRRADYLGHPLQLNRYEWVPGTHILAFNTRVETYGLVLNDDLYQVDADTLEYAMLLPAGEGGEFFYSPDGSQIAVATPDAIILTDANGDNPRELLTYTQVNTASEFWYYAQPVWAADSSSLRVVIPPVDLPAFPPQPSSVWEILTDGTPARLLGSITALHSAPYLFSPDLTHLAYLAPQDDAQPGEPGKLEIAGLDDGSSSTYDVEAYYIYGWSTDGQSVAFLANPARSQALIGQLNGSVFHAYEVAEGAVIEVKWVDNTRYLLLAQVTQGWAVVLGDLVEPATTIATVAGMPPAFDLAR